MLRFLAILGDYGDFQSLALPKASLHSLLQQLGCSNWVAYVKDCTDSTDSSQNFGVTYFMAIFARYY